MKVLRSRGAAAVILIVVIAASTVFGSHRSLQAQADKVTDQNEYVMRDLRTRAEVGHNFYTVAQRYLPDDDPSMTALQGALDEIDQNLTDPLAQDVLRTALDGMSALNSSSTRLTEQDARYIKGFQAQLRAVEDTLSRDPYNDLAEEFNREILGGFPAGLLGKLTGVEQLPVYR